MRSPYLYLIPLHIAFLSLSCDDPNSTPGVWDSGDEGALVPFVTGIDPPDSAFAGSDEITIYGGNFGEDKDGVFVYFNTGLGEVIAAENSSIVVIPPNIISDSITIKIAAYGAFQFAQYQKNYILYPRIIKYGAFDALDESIWGLEADNDENVYVGLSSFPEGTIDKLTPPAGIRESAFINAVLQTPFSMRIGPDDHIYYVDGANPFIIKHDLETGSPSYNTLPGIAFDLDFDTNGNLYCGGTGQNLYKVQTDLSSVVAADYNEISIRVVRVYDGYVYVGGNYTGEDEGIPNVGIWRNQILSSDGSLDEKEMYLDWSEHAGENSNITCITFDEEGIMYVSSDADVAIATIDSEMKFAELYPNILSAPITKMTWGSGDYLYLNFRGAPRALYRLEMGIKGAPYYGRQ